MGMFDFIKEAGAKIFGTDDKDKGDVTRPLSAHLRDHGIDASNVRFRFEGDTVTMEGWVPDMDTREKAVLIVGNVEGVGKVNDQLRVGPAPTGGAAGPGPQTVGLRGAGGSGNGNGNWRSGTYTVQKGDTLSAIAKSQYGDSGKYPLIFKANQPMLKDPDKIYPGQVLRIPPQA